MKDHSYEIKLEWTGNKGSGTFDYRSYSRDHIISAKAKGLEILGSSDPGFRGDKSRYNPEELFLASISSCHMLWYLHLCAVNGVIVLEYSDEPKGVMNENDNGSGQFSSVLLHPNVKVSKESMVEKANELHHKANEMCFIANSCNFEIKHAPQCSVA